MPLYMDHHKNFEGLTAEAVAEDHKKDLEVQDKHGAKAFEYWLNARTTTRISSPGQARSEGS
jgi:hypothetical protein